MDRALLRHQMTQRATAAPRSALKETSLEGILDAVDVDFAFAMQGSAVANGAQGMAEKNAETTPTPALPVDHVRPDHALKCTQSAALPVDHVRPGHALKCTPSPALPVDHVRPGHAIQPIPSPPLPIDNDRPRKAPKTTSPSIQYPWPSPLLPTHDMSGSAPGGPEDFSAVVSSLLLEVSWPFGTALAPPAKKIDNDQPPPPPPPPSPELITAKNPASDHPVAAPSPKILRPSPKPPVSKSLIQKKTTTGEDYMLRARNARQKWPSIKEKATHTLEQLLASKPSSPVHEIFRQQLRAVKNARAGGQKQALLAVLQYLHIQDIIIGKFAQDSFKDGFFGWNAFTVVKGVNFVGMLNVLFAGLSYDAMCLAFRRCGFMVARPHKFCHLMQGVGTAVWQQHQQDRYRANT